MILFGAFYWFLGSLAKMIDGLCSEERENGNGKEEGKGGKEGRGGMKVYDDDIDILVKVGTKSMERILSSTTDAQLKSWQRICPV